MVICKDGSISIKELNNHLMRNSINTITDGVSTISCGGEKSSVWIKIGNGGFKMIYCHGSFRFDIPQTNDGKNLATKRMMDVLNWIVDCASLQMGGGGNMTHDSMNFVYDLKKKLLKTLRKSTTLQVNIKILYCTKNDLSLLILFGSSVYEYKIIKSFNNNTCVVASSHNDGKSDSNSTHLIVNHVVTSNSAFNKLSRFWTN